MDPSLARSRVDHAPKCAVKIVLDYHLVSLYQCLLEAVHVTCVSPKVSCAARCMVDINTV